MALKTHLAIGLVSKITSFEVTWVRSHFAAAVALNTDITAGMTGLA